MSKGTAGSVHPHKLATHFLQAALESGQVELFSWAPVEKFEEDQEGGWTVDVGPRGVVRTRQIIVCTDGHTPHLFPDQLIAKQ